MNTDRTPQRAQYGESYWFVNESFQVEVDEDYNYSMDRERYRVGNYFLREEDADYIARKLKQLVGTFHQTINAIDAKIARGV